MTLTTNPRSERIFEPGPLPLFRGVVANLHLLRKEMVTSSLVPGRPGPGTLHLVSDFQKNFSASLLMGDCGADFLKPICRGHWNCNFACGHHL